MRSIFLVLALLIFTSLPAAAATRTVQINIATGFVRAIVDGAVSTPAPAGVLFIVLTDDSIEVKAGWTYSLVTKTFTPPQPGED